MRDEILRWIDQADEELSVAKISFDNKKYFAAAFWCQQSLEKFLKALYMFKNKKSPGTTHSLTYLGRETGVSAKYNVFLRNLSSEYFFSRYPDAIEDVPYKTYSEDEINDYLKNTKEIIKWIKSEMNL